MGVVYSAVDEKHGRTVALKVPFAAAVRDGRSMRRFLREARMATTITHDNAVKVLAVEEQDGLPVMVMELLEGQSLTARIAEAGRLSLGEVARLMVPVLGALADAHARGIVHRDIKPDNIFLAGSGDRVVPKVLDFGVAKVLHTSAGAESMKLTITGTMLGTPYYMAPEQAAARATFDHRVDLWAIGVVIYEALSGRRPFDGDVYGQIFAAIFGDDPPPIRERAPELPDDIVELLDRCLKKRPEERPASAGEIAQVLARFASLPAMSYPQPRNTEHGADSDDASDPAVAAGGMKRHAASTTSPVARSGRAWIVAAAIAVLAGIGGVKRMAARSEAPGAGVGSSSSATGIPPAAASPASATGPGMASEKGAPPPGGDTAAARLAGIPDAGAHHVVAAPATAAAPPPVPAQTRARPHPRGGQPAPGRHEPAPPTGTPSTGIIDTL